MAPPRLLYCMVATSLAMGAARVMAEGGTDLRFRANTALVHDSNIFRLSSGANVQALTGRSSAAETIGITGVGLNYNKAYSLQRVEFDLAVNKYSYQNFSYLNFNAIDYNAAWRWAYTPQLRGNLTTSREQTLNNFVDFQGFNLRNVRADTNARFDATYELDARWRISAGLNQSARNNSVQISQEADYRLAGAQAGVRYVLASGSALGYTWTNSAGTYTSNRSIPSPGFFDDGFDQTDNAIVATWVIGRDSSADFRIGQRSRKYPTYPQRNFNGFTGAATLNWSLSPKSGLSAGWARDLATFETGDFNFTQTDRFSVGPVWQISPKATVRAQLAYAARDFRGTPTGVATLSRRDITRDASLSLDWQPFSYLTFGAAVQNARRSSSLAGFDYTSNSVNLSAQFTY